MKKPSWRLENALICELGGKEFTFLSVKVRNLNEILIVPTEVTLQFRWKRFQTIFSKEMFSQTQEKLRIEIEARTLNFRLLQETIDEELPNQILARQIVFDHQIV